MKRVLPEGFSGTVRGFVAEQDGEIVGAMGVLHTSPPQAFSTMWEPMRDHPRLIVKAMGLFREMLEKNYTYVVAMASKTEHNSPRVLERVGFRPFLRATDEHRGVWEWQIR